MHFARVTIAIRDIKICLLFFSFALFFVINALFFTDDTIHKIYEDQGKYNFAYQILRILYSSMIFFVINALISFFSLTEKVIIGIKTSEKKEDLDINQIKKKLKLRFIIFYIFIFLFLIAFWFYASCFCAVYYNAQFHFLKDSLIGFGLLFVYLYL